ncbi:DUF1501 domain-containing protein [Sabulilitoribacter multivorans]|uniref:DUF1501 domain-containing protein n=1 Tax=Flaviramulus multivorans TaxID=1304750 RepID=A0ABS9IJZ7_9FLAO|nr:DUF1501 domain-containing protein [Flaviramulus multivorans]MCF7560917.1 DUF1501 domain-containing protein [Flaviramulus multivorans]
MTKHKNHISRRKFLGQSCSALGYTTLFSSLINLKAIAATAMDNSPLVTAGGDYKALVCLMLAGGNDSFNMLIPKGNNEYNEYATTRSNLAIPQNDVLQINPNTTDGRTFGLHPSMPDVRQLFDNGNLAFLSNVGTLIEPSTKTDIKNGIVKTPLGLFSHSDQVQQWQTGRPHERTNIGWGGRIAELVQSMNSNQNISMNVSLKGTNLFQRGNEVIPYAISNQGSIGISGYNGQNRFNQLRTQALNTMLERDYQDIFKNTYKNTIKSSNDSSLEFQSAIDEVSDFSTIMPEYNNLAAQLRMVAKTIASRDTLGFSRQTFFVQVGGWDHHDELLLSQASKLAVVNDALKYFNDVMTELSISDCVTLFSVSDFARTLTSNGNGTDHAWGGNAFMMGGAVNGKEIYGDYPTLALNSSVDLQDGVIIPTTAADLYIAELALWFGVPASELSTILPNLENFYDVNSGQPPIGFMNMA